MNFYDEFMWDCYFEKRAFLFDVDGRITLDPLNGESSGESKIAYIDRDNWNIESSEKKYLKQFGSSINILYGKKYLRRSINMINKFKSESWLKLPVLEELFLKNSLTIGVLGFVKKKKKNILIGSMVVTIFPNILVVETLETPYNKIGIAFILKTIGRFIQKYHFKYIDFQIYQTSKQLEPDKRFLYKKRIGCLITTEKEYQEIALAKAKLLFNGNPCGKCCANMTYSEAISLPEAFPILQNDETKNSIHKINENSYLFKIGKTYNNGYKCPFYTESKCIIHKFRPEFCRKLECGSLRCFISITGYEFNKTLNN